MKCTNRTAVSQLRYLPGFDSCTLRSFLVPSVASVVHLEWNTLLVFWTALNSPVYVLKRTLDFSESHCGSTFL